MRLRFAPSPTGQLHVGNARTALFNWLLARGSGGEFILRIEDTDAERSTLASETAILEDLRWLGLTWDEGPDVGGALGPYRQSERLALYRSYGEELLARSRAYYCFCSTEQLEAERQAALAAGLPPRYSGRCRGPRSGGRRGSGWRQGEPAALRFRVGEGDEVVFEDLVRGRVAFAREVIGDPVILRSDGRPAYNFAVVVDDALMKVTHVIRGEDHVSNTPRQLLIYEALGWSPPGVRASRARDGARPQPVVEAARRDVGAGVPRAGLPAGSAGQLPGAPGVVARRHRRGAAGRGTRRAVPRRGRGQERRACSTPTNSRG